MHCVGEYIKVVFYDRRLQELDLSMVILYVRVLKQRSYQFKSKLVLHVQNPPNHG